MSEDEKAVFAAHWERLQRLHAEGTVILPGPTLGRTNTGIVVIEAPDDARDQSAARLWWTA